MVRCPLIAVTVSRSGDLYVIFPQGIVRVTNVGNTLNIGLIGVAAATASAAGSAVATEELRYRMLRSVAPIAQRLGRKRKEESSAEDYVILRLLGHKPGLRVQDLRALLPREKPTLVKLALLERLGYLSSTRTGFFGGKYPRRK